MAIAKSIPVPLYTETSVDVISKFFHIFPGEIALIQAFGFMDYKSREGNEQQQVPQVACLEMILFKAEPFTERDQCSCPALDLSKYQSQILAVETLRANGCTYELSKCNNIMLLNIPGSYRFVMNDATAVGNARAYLRIMSKAEFTWDSKLFVGER